MDDLNDIVVDLLGSVRGRCLDIGAKDGLGGCQVLPLLELGWHAVLVEPHESNCRRMRDAYAERGILDRCTIIQAAVVPWDSAPNTITIYDMVDTTVDMPTGCSCLDAQWVLNCAAANQLPQLLFEATVPVLTLAQLLHTVGMDFDFVTIDTEDLSIPLCQAMPWDSMPTRLLTTEGRRDHIPLIESKGWVCREIMHHDLVFGR